MQSTTRRPGLHLAGPVSAVMRNVAIKMITDGTPPSSLGTILPSPHQDYLRALFIGPMSQVHLFLKPQDGTKNNSNNNFVGIDVDGNNNVIYFDEWNIEEVLRHARAKSQSRCSSPTDQEDTTNADMETVHYEQQLSVKLVQRRTSRAIAALQKKVIGWRAFDNMLDQRNNECMEVIINDPLIERPGALENLIGYWRNKLGWIEPSTGYWFDTAAALTGGQKFRFVAYGIPEDASADPVPITSSEDGSSTTNDADVLNNITKSQQKRKYTWSNLSGTFLRPEQLESLHAKIHRDRNAWLVSELGRIERERDTDLVTEGVAFIIPYLNGTIPDNTEFAKWSGGREMPGQKGTRRRKVKKRAPERRFGCVEFIPEDGGLRPLEMLEKAAADVEVEAGKEKTGTTPDKDIDQEENFHDPEKGKKRKRTEEPEEVSTAVEQPQKQQPKGVTFVSPTTEAAPATSKTEQLSEREASPSKKRRKITPQTFTAAKPRSPSVNVQPPKVAEPVKSPQKKRSQRKTTPAPAAKPKPPPKPKVKAEEPPAPAATRKSSRIAKRKADDDLEEVGAENNDEAPVGDRTKRAVSTGPSKKRKLDTAATTTTTTAPKTKAADPIADADTREKTVSAEPVTESIENPQPPPAPRTRKRAASAKPPSKPTAKKPTTRKATTTSPTHPPTITTSPNTRPSPPSDTPQTPPPPNPTNTPLSPSYTSTIPPLTQQSRTDILNTYPLLNHLDPTRQDLWLEFLNLYARTDGVRGKLGEWFAREGAVNREGEFLRVLGGMVGRIRRGDEEEGEEGEGEGVWSWVD